MNGRQEACLAPRLHDLPGEEHGKIQQPDRDSDDEGDSRSGPADLWLAPPSRLLGGCGRTKVLAYEHPNVDSKGLRERLEKGGVDARSFLGYPSVVDG